MCTVNKKDFSYVLSTKSNVVITGDSLAYNRYDFMREPRSNAYECYSGMASWSFLLRDYLIRNQIDFIPARKMRLSPDLPYQYFTECAFSCLVPFMEEGICITLKADEQIILSEKETYMYLLTDIEKGGTIDVDGERINIRGNKDIYGGHEIMRIRLTEGKIISIDEEIRLNIIGFSKTGNQVFMTGSGSKTTKWLYENLQERVLKFSPDLLIMIIGANDRSNSNVQEAHESMSSILKKAGCETIILTTPHSTTTDPDNGNIYVPDEKVTKPFIDNLYSIAYEYGVPLIDLFKFFNGVESSIWRFDNVHFSVKGNQMLYNYIIKDFFGG